MCYLHAVVMIKPRSLALCSNSTTARTTVPLALIKPPCNPNTTKFCIIHKLANYSSHSQIQIMNILSQSIRVPAPIPAAHHRLQIKIKLPSVSYHQARFESVQPYRSDCTCIKNMVTTYSAVTCSSSLCMHCYPPFSSSLPMC